MIQAPRKDVVKIVIARLLVHLLPEVSVSILFFAPITACQGPAIGIPEALDKPMKEAPYRVNRPSPPFVLDLRLLESIHSVEIAQEDRSTKEGPAYRPSCLNCPHIPRSRPLIGRWVPALDLPQNLQDGLGSGIALCHESNPLLPDGL